MRGPEPERTGNEQESGIPEARVDGRQLAQAAGRDEAFRELGDAGLGFEPVQHGVVRDDRSKWKRIPQHPRQGEENGEEDVAVEGAVEGLAVFGEPVLAQLDAASEILYRLACAGGAAS